MIAALLVAAGPVQAASASGEPEEEPYHVEDPFLIEEEPAAEEQPATPTTAETPPPSGERIVCRSRPELGTRLRRLRVCMTAAEWEHHETNMEQQRRDINEWGAQGGGTPL